MKVALFVFMSLGFLTESALIPQKSKEIKVDPSSVSSVVF